jgi:hypothetical protein
MIRRTHAADLAGCGHYQRGSSAASIAVWAARQFGRPLTWLAIRIWS